MPTEIKNLTLAGFPNLWSGEGPVWCPVGNVRESIESANEQGEAGMLRGTKHFPPGTRIYLRRLIGYRNSRIDQPIVEVVGRHRGSHHYVCLIMRASWIEKWHVDLVYSPTVIRLLLPKWDGTSDSEVTAAEYVSALSK